MAQSTALSKEFLELIRAIGEAKSKQEEDRIIIAELKTLKGKLAEKDISKKKMREYLIRAIYAEMLGHEASWVYIHGVNLTQSSDILDKRIGYLSVGLFLHENHELIILLINTIQRDLKSSNFLDVCAALAAACKLLNAETIPAVLPMVVDLLAHGQELVRKKAVMALHHFWQRNPGSVAHLQDKFRRALCDRDPAVMNASLAVFYDQIVADPMPYKDLVPSFVSILKQITEHRLSRDYDYHRIPAPWMQVKILKILALLGADDQRTSEGMYEVLNEVMKRADTGINAGYAVVYECVRTITSIYPNTPLLEAAASSISRFITSENQNLRYLGITALAAIVGVDRKYAAEHQMVVIECMEDPDETLKRKTLDLLCKITTPGNVVVIVDKLTSYLRNTTDATLRKELVSRITQLAERYAPDNVWFLNTMNNVFELGGDLVQEETAHNLMRLIAEGSGEDEQADLDLKIQAVTTYATLLEKTTISDGLMQVIAWVVGEYAYVCEEFTEEDMLNRLCDAIERQHEDSSTRGWIFSALVKISARMGDCPPQVRELLDKYTSSKVLDLQQRCYEILELVKRQDTSAAVLPIDGSCEDLEVDPDLPFLNGYVTNALRRGAKPYITIEEREDMGLGGGGGASSVDKSGLMGGLRFEQYAAPQVGKYAVGTAKDPDSLNYLRDVQIDTPGGGAGGAGGDADESARKEGLALGGVKKKWGRQGYQGDDTSKPATLSGVVAPSSGFGSTPAPAATQPAVTPGYNAPASNEPEPLRTSGHGGSFDTRKNQNTAAAAPAKPREATEKEKLAASLFGDTFGGGGGGAAAPAGGAGRGRGAGGASATGAKKTPAPTGGPGAAVKTTPAPAGGNADMLLDLGFGGGGGGGGMPMTTTAAPAASRPGGAGMQPKPLDLLDLFDGPPSTTSAPATNVLAPSSGGVLDPFGGLLGGGGGGAGAAGGSPNYDILRTGGSAAPIGGASLGSFGQPAPVTIPASLSGELEGQRNPDDQQMIGQDANLYASFYRVYKANHTAVAVFLTNRSNEVLSQIAIAFDVPESIRVDYVGEPAPKLGAANRLSLAQPLGPGQHAIIVLRVNFGGRFSSAVLDIVQKVTYVKSNMSLSLDFKIPLTLTDLLRTLKMTTNEFGGKWGSTPQERKGRINGACTSPQEFTNRISRLFNIFPVQTINTEVISCGKVLAFSELYVLVHGKTGPGGVDLIVRTNDKNFSDAVFQLAQKILA